MITKDRLRKLIKERKRTVSFNEKIRRSQVIWDKLEKDDTFRSAQTIMLYWSMKDEVHTHDFIKKWYHAKQIILPAVNGELLDLKVYSGPESLRKGESYGIMEPAGENFRQSEKIELMIIPGVAFDRFNNRLGRGKAYYDKLLRTYSGLKYGVCFDFQLVDKVPTNQHDIKMDAVITDS